MRSAQYFNSPSSFGLGIPNIYPLSASHFWGSQKWLPYFTAIPSPSPFSASIFQSNATLEGIAPRASLLCQIDIAICCLFHFHHILLPFLASLRIGRLQFSSSDTELEHSTSSTRRSEQRLVMLALRNSAADEKSLAYTKLLSGELSPSSPPASQQQHKKSSSRKSQPKSRNIWKAFFIKK